jgi:hypothetical protein
LGSTAGRPWVEHAGGDGDAERVVGECEEDNLFDVAHHRSASDSSLLRLIETDEFSRLDEKAFY